MTVTSSTINNIDVDTEEHTEEHTEYAMVNTLVKTFEIHLETNRQLHLIITCRSSIKSIIEREATFKNDFDKQVIMKNVLQTFLKDEENELIQQYLHTRHTWVQ